GPASDGPAGLFAALRSAEHADRPGARGRCSRSAAGRFSRRADRRPPGHRGAVTETLGGTPHLYACSALTSGRRPAGTAYNRQTPVMGADPGPPPPISGELRPVVG